MMKIPAKVEHVWSGPLNIVCRVHAADAENIFFFSSFDWILEITNHKVNSEQSIIQVGIYLTKNVMWMWKHVDDWRRRHVLTVMQAGSLLNNAHSKRCIVWGECEDTLMIGGMYLKQASSLLDNTHTVHSKRCAVCNESQSSLLHTIQHAKAFIYYHIIHNNMIYEVKRCSHLV